MSKFAFDEYTLKARVTPALIALFPYLYVMHSTEMGLTSLINSILLSSVILFVLANIVREMGVTRERHLFTAWGGKPTTLILRHKDKTLSPILKKHYHEVLARLYGQLPTEAYETANPHESDEIYDACVKWLLENTRDRSKFYLLGQENIAYGFWRNLLALKSAGIGLAAFSLFITLGAFILSNFGLYTLDARILLAPVVSIATLLFWFRYVNANMVRNAAYGYAKTLLAQCDNPALGNS